jgi:hypothetical protein
MIWPNVRVVYVDPVCVGRLRIRRVRAVRRAPVVLVSRCVDENCTYIV